MKYFYKYLWEVERAYKKEELHDVCVAVSAGSVQRTDSSDRVRASVFAVVSENESNQLDISALARPATNRCESQQCN